MANKNLHKAKDSKNDEFYTQLEDIEKELSHYKDHFKDKIVFCNCDDPYESNFFKYFAMNFNFLGLKKLVATGYSISPIAFTQLSIFDIDEQAQRRNPAYKIEITEVYDENGDGAINFDDIKDILKKGNSKNKLTWLKGDGDFRSEESIELLKKADIVVTNPPFSLFREFIALMENYNKKFLVIGNMNAITYKEVFKLIKENRLWSGYGFNRSMVFQSPYENKLEANRKFCESKGYFGKNYIKTPAVNWFTNLDTKKRHEDLILVKKYNPIDYPKYDNYDAIEVSKVKDIPRDWDGVMGVPITFMDKFNPDQFEIVGHPQSNILPDGWRGVSAKFVELYYSQGNKGAIREGWINPAYIDNDGNAIVPYQRILIRRREVS